MPKVYLLDYVAGNIRSLVNAIEKIGYEVEWIRSPEQIVDAEVRSLRDVPPSPLLTSRYLEAKQKPSWRIVQSANVVSRGL